MSTGQRSWKTADSGRRRNTRKLTIGLLAAMVAGLLALLVVVILPLFRPLPRTWYVTLSVDLPRTDEQTLWTFRSMPNFAGQVSDRNIQDLFDKLNNQQTLEIPAGIESLRTLRQIADRDTLVVYCSRQAVVVDPDPEDSELELDVRLGTESNYDLFKKDVLTQLDDHAGQTLLLLDLPAPRPGLANGILADDVLYVIRQAIEGTNKLTVICSREYGQGNREWERAASGADSQGQDSVTKEFTGRQFDGTRFAHVLEEVLTQRERTSDRIHVEELLRKLQKSVGAQQTVHRISALQSSIADIRLPLAKVLPDENQTDRSSEPAVDSTAEEPPTTEEDQNQVEPPRLSPWQRLTQQRSGLRNTAAVADARWQQLNQTLVTMRLSLLHGQSEFAGRMEETAETQLRNLEPPRSLLPDEKRDRWMAATLTAPQGAKDETAVIKAREKRNELMKLPAESESAARVDCNCPDDPAVRAALVIAMVDKLGDLAEATTNTADAAGRQLAEDELKNLVQAIGYVKNEWSLDWAQSDWPHELWTMHAVLAAGPSGRTPSVAVLPALRRLINLQRRTFCLACGYQNQNSPTPMLRAVWNDCKHDFQSAIPQLQAARQWLKLGSAGVAWADKLLDSTETLLQTDVDQACETWCHEQRLDSERFVVVQFLTRQLEEASLSENGLGDLLKIDHREMSASDWPEEIVSREINTDHIRNLYNLTQKNQRKSAGVASSRPQLPQPDKQVQTLVAGPGETEDPGTKTRTGVCLGFWSIRLLQFRTGKPVEELLEQWQDLVQQVRKQQQSAASPQAMITARTRLAQSLGKAWKEFSDGSGAQPSATLHEFYVQTADTMSVMNISNYKAASEATMTAPPESMLTESGNVLIEITFDRSDTDRFLYIQLPENSELEFGAGTGQDNWWTVPVKASTESKHISVRTAPGAALTEQTDLTIALVADTKTGTELLAHQAVTLQPNKSTRWEAKFFFTAGESPELKNLYLEDKKTLFLPPTTVLNDSLKNIQVQLQLTSGQADEAEVICSFAPDISRRLKVRQLASGKRGVVVPVPQPAVPDREAVPEYNITDGLTFRITPYTGDRKGPEQTVTINPQLKNNADDFVELPVPKWNAQTHTLTLNIKPRTGLPAWKTPVTLPIAIHFSPRLISLLIEGEGSPLKNPDLKEEGKFTFKFAKAASYSDLEFGLSVAGIPYYWWWALREDGDPKPVGNRAPFVRMILEVTDKEEGKVQGDPFYLLDHTQKTPVQDDSAPADRPFDVKMALGNNLPEASTLRLRIKPVDRSAVTLYEFPLIHGRYHETVAVTAGAEPDHWQIKTHTELFQHGPIELIDEYDYSNGKYELITRLTTSDGVKTDTNEIVIDDTAPEISVWINRKEVKDGFLPIELPADTRQDKPVELSVQARDPESGVDWQSLNVIRKSGDQEGPLDETGNTDSKHARTFDLFADLPTPQQGTETTGTAFVTIRNKAGLSSQHNVTFRIRRRKSITGTLIVTWKNKSKRTLFLRGSETLQRTGTSPLSFAEVPFGKGYKIQEGGIVVKDNIDFTLDKQKFSLDE